MKTLCYCMAVAGLLLIMASFVKAQDLIIVQSPIEEAAAKKLDEKITALEDAVKDMSKESADVTSSDALPPAPVTIATEDPSDCASSFRNPTAKTPVRTTLAKVASVPLNLLKSFKPVSQCGPEGCTVEQEISSYSYTPVLPQRTYSFSPGRPAALFNPTPQPLFLNTWRTIQPQYRGESYFTRGPLFRFNVFGQARKPLLFGVRGCR